MSDVSTNVLNSKAISNLVSFKVKSTYYVKTERIDKMDKIS